MGKFLRTTSVVAVAALLAGTALATGNLENPRNGAT